MDTEDSNQHTGSDEDRFDPPAEPWEEALARQKGLNGVGELRRLWAEIPPEPWEKEAMQRHGVTSLEQFRRLSAAPPSPKYNRSGFQEALWVHWIDQKPDLKTPIKIDHDHHCFQCQAYWGCLDEFCHLPTEEACPWHGGGWNTAAVSHTHECLQCEPTMGEDVDTNDRIHVQADCKLPRLWPCTEHTARRSFPRFDRRQYSELRENEQMGEGESSRRQEPLTTVPTGFESGGAAVVAFAVQLSDFSKAIRGLRPARARGKKVLADFVDINALTSEIEIVAPGVSLRFPAQVVRSGYARVPYLTFEWFAKALKTYRQSAAEVSISDGQVRIANLRFKHPDISVRLIGSRIADLPIDAPLPDVLALLTRFTTEELSESGLLARMLAAQEEAKKLMDRAMKALAPLEINREELSQFITDRLKRRAQPR